MTKATHEAVVAAAAKPAELSALLCKLDVAAAKLEGSAARLAIWANENVVVLEYVVVVESNPRPSTWARALCDFFDSSRHLDNSFTDVSDHLRRDDAARSQRRGQFKGKVSYLVDRLKVLNAEGIVTDAELRSLSKTLGAICLRLPNVEPENDPTDEGGATSNNLGRLLMSLTRAIGYGHGKGQGDLYSAKKAAETVTKIMGMYGFKISAKSLENLNSAARK